MKRLLLALFVRSGLLALWRYWHRRSVTVLMLHGVDGAGPDAAWSPLWSRPRVEQIAQVLGELCKYYTPVSMHDAVEIVAGRARPVNNALVVTFDDGYRNNFTDALPVLNKLGVPATFFVATGYVETGKPYWVDRLDYLLQHVPVDLRLLHDGKYEFDLRTQDRAELEERYKTMRRTLKDREHEDRELSRIVDAFAEYLESSSESRIENILADDPYASIATWAEQAEALADGATIGSHSVDHFRLTAIPRDSVDPQLVDSKRQIEDRLGIECEFFCYPNGDLDDFIRERVQSAGYKAAVSTEYGLNRPGDDLFRLKRQPMPLSDNMHYNLLRISGILETIPLGAFFRGS